jgi:opacity protein-like surface antigen
MQKLIASILLLVGFAAPSLAQETPRVELFAGYTGVRSNEPPKACGCFWMNGGSGSVAYNLNSWVGVVGDFGAVHAGNVNSTGLDLTLTSYLFGPRVSYRRLERFTPFAQLLLGGAHLSGSLKGPATASADEFAMTLGGGLDVAISRHFALRPVQLEYFRTGFSNGLNGSQNNLRFTTGVVLRFGRK